jgi:Protein of unknown function (DUF2934)
MQSKPQGQATAPERAKPVEPAPISVTPSARSEASTGSFSKDPSPFTRHPTLSPESSAYRELVAITAYYRAERRGFAPGGEVEDWLDAEREVAARLHELRRV